MFQKLLSQYDPFLVGRTVLFSTKASSCLSHRSVVWMTVLLAPSPMTTVVVCSLRVTLSELPANSLRSVSGYTNHILSVFCAMTRKCRSQKQYSSCKEGRRNQGGESSTVPFSIPMVHNKGRLSYKLRFSS